MPPTCVQNLVKSYRQVFEKMGFEVFGVRGVFGVHHLLAVPCPTWPLHVVALGTSKKTNLVRGKSPHIWRRYEGFNFLYFGLHLLETVSMNFRFFLSDRLFVLSSSDSENLNEFWQRNSRKVILNVGTENLYGGQKREKLTWANGNGHQ